MNKSKSQQTNTNEQMNEGANKWANLILRKTMIEQTNWPNEPKEQMMSMNAVHDKMD